MDMAAKRQYLMRLQGEYLKADKAAKTGILDEFTKNTGHNRKYVIGQLNKVNLTRIQSPSKKRQSRYGPEMMEPLEKLYDIFDCACAQRLKPAIETEVERLRSFGEVTISDEQAKLLKAMSISTMDRRLSKIRHKHNKKGVSSTKPGSLLKQQIAIRLTKWDTRKVGFLEVDLVSHCGSNSSGQFAHTASLTDIASGWWEGEGIPNKGQLATLRAIQQMRSRCPFDWQGIDSDNGSEFINYHLLNYCQKETLEFTRSRPNHKNDNAYVEQKNWTHVRQVVGYARYDTQDELDIMNDLYRNELRLYKNLFLPQLKLKSKTRKSGHLKRQYETAKTPYQRLLDSEQLTEQQLQYLKQLYSKLNPAKLKRQIEKKLFKLRLAFQNKGWTDNSQKDGQQPLQTCPQRKSNQKEKKAVSLSIKS